MYIYVYIYIYTYILIELDFSSVVSAVVEGLFNIGWGVCGPVAGQSAV